MSEINTLDQLDSALTDVIPAQEPEGDTQPQVEPAVPDSTVTEVELPDGEAKEKEPEEQKGFYTKEQQAAFKSNRAFAGMRNENSIMRNALYQMAAAQGYNGDAKDIHGIATFIDQKNMVNAPAPAAETPQSVQQQTQQDPNQYSQIVSRLQQENIQLKQEHTEFLAKQGFARLQEMYNLTQDDLATYAEQLGERGLDPWANPQVNVIDQFKILNFETLVAREAEKQAQVLLQRELEAANNSTKPTGVRSGSGGETGKVNTLSELDALLDGLKT